MKKLRYCETMIGMLGLKTTTVNIETFKCTTYSSKYEDPAVILNLTFKTKSIINKEFIQPFKNIFSMKLVFGLIEL